MAVTGLSKTMLAAGISYIISFMRAMKIGTISHPFHECDGNIFQFYLT